MSRRRERDHVGAVADAITELVATAVTATIAERSPVPSRGCIESVLAVDEAAASDQDGGPAELLTTILLLGRLSAAREQLADRPDRVESALDWIEHALGRRYRARARYTAGALDTEAGAAEVMEYRTALQEDFLPSMIWLLAGLVAVHGGGDVAWLDTLQPAPTDVSRSRSAG